MICQVLIFRNIGYNVPASDLVKMSVKDSTKFVFEYPLAHLLTDGISDLFTTRIALPEGSKVLSVETGDVRAEVSYDKTFSYLDFIGRPTVVI